MKPFIMEAQKMSASGRKNGRNSVFPVLTSVVDCSVKGTSMRAKKKNIAARNTAGTANIKYDTRHPRREAIALFATIQQG